MSALAKRMARTWRTAIGGGLLLAAGLAHAGTVHYYYTDPQGTVLAKADAQGAIVARYDYAPYGTSAPNLDAAPAGPGYTGHVNDPDTGLVYMQARYYDPVVGRFLSVDPVGPAVGNPYNFNRYTYANNNPIVNIDPDGRRADERQDRPQGGCTGSLTGNGCAGLPLSITQVASPSAAASSQRTPMEKPARIADAVISTIFGTYANEMKRPNHPTKIPDKLAHQMFMTGAAGTALAASPAVGVLATTDAPVVAEGAAVAAGAAGRVGGRAVLMGCLAMSCAHGADDPDKFVEDRVMLQEMYNNTKEAGSELFKVVFGDGKK